MKQRVWIVSELYAPEMTSTGYFLTILAEELAKTYDVAVLCGQPSYWARGKRGPSREKLNGVDVQRCWASTLNKNNYLFRSINLITISLSIFVTALFRLRRAEIVITVTNPPLLPYVMALATRIRRGRFVLLVHDVYPEALACLGLMASESIGMRFLNKASLWLYSTAYRIIAIGRDMRDLLCKKIPPLCNRIVVATNWANLEQISPMERSENRLLRRETLEDKFVVQFWGNMGRPQGIEDLFEAAELIKDESNIHFLVIGWGSKKRWAIEEKARRGLLNMTILDPLPYEESCSVQNACDLAVNALVAGMAGISVPSRTYNAMAAAKPLMVICDSNSEVAFMVREESIGWVIPPGRPDLIAEVLREAKDDRSRLRAMGERARAAVESKYSIGHVARIYRSLIEEIRE